MEIDEIDWKKKLSSCEENSHKTSPDDNFVSFPSDSLDLLIPFGINPLAETALQMQILRR